MIERQYRPGDPRGPRLLAKPASSAPAHVTGPNVLLAERITASEVIAPRVPGSNRLQVRIAGPEPHASGKHADPFSAAPTPATSVNASAKAQDHQQGSNTSNGRGAEAHSRPAHFGCRFGR